MRLATAPGAWGIEPPARAGYPPWTRVLDEIAEAGFDGCELGPLGYLPAGDELRAALAERGLELAAGFVMEPLSVAAERERILAVARETCAVLRAGGATTLVVIDALAPERSATAGRDDAAEGLSAAGWERLVACVRAVSAIAAEHGLSAALHPHAGTHIEFADEIDRVMDALDAGDAGLCVDSGHAAYAGIDPAALVDRYAGRIAHVHVKDLDAALLADCIRRHRSFDDAVALGVFRSLGAGSLDLRAFAEALRRAGYDGWATVEQDRPLATLDSALSDARASIAHARSLGLGR